MAHSTRIPWKRISAESAAIVGSILIAFSIDAWWEDRIEREAEMWMLQRLYADFSEISSSLEVNEGEHRQALEACVSLLDMSAEGEPLPMTPEVDSMVGYAFLTARTFNPGSGAVDAFLNNETSQLVRNQPLADLLIKWSGLVEELQEEEAQLMKGVVERWTPYLASRTDLGPYYAVLNEIFADLPEETRSPGDRRPLVVDSEFESQLIDRYRWQVIALRDQQPLRVAADEILGLLGEELGK